CAAVAAALEGVRHALRDTVVASRDDAVVDDKYRANLVTRVEGRAPALLVVARELQVVGLARHADGDVPDASPPFRFGSRSLLLIAAKGDNMSVLVASEIPRTRG